MENNKTSKDIIEKITEELKKEVDADGLYKQLIEDLDPQLVSAMIGTENTIFDYTPLVKYLVYYSFRNGVAYALDRIDVVEIESEEEDKK